MLNIKTVSFAVLTFALTACNTSKPNHLILKSESGATFAAGENYYTNTYPSPFKTLGPYSDIDTMDFLVENEKRADTRLFTFSDSGIDKSFGFKYASIFKHADVEPFAKDTITWLGHASFLIQDSNGLSFLTDPVFGEFDGVVGHVGAFLFNELKRLGPSPIKASSLDFVDAVLLSHDHYDHYSTSTLEQIPSEYGLYVPIGMEKEVSISEKKVVAMDWYTQSSMQNSTIHFLPAHHYSNRSIFDQNESLWGGWLIESQGKKIYFAGDTGYSPIFKDINEKYGEIDVCLMPIVSYGKHYRSVHLAPEDAVQAALDLKCKVFVPWGYGVWQLGFEHVNEPLRRLKLALKLVNPDFKVRILNIGESFKLSELL